MSDLIGEAWEDIRLHVEDELRSKNMARYEVWVSWDMSEAAYTSQDMMDALTAFANILKTADGMRVEVRADDGKVIAAYPVEEQKVSM